MSASYHSAAENIFDVKSSVSIDATCNFHWQSNGLKTAQSAVCNVCSGLIKLKMIISIIQTLHGLRILHTYQRLSDAALKHVFQTVIIAKLSYASSSWWGFTSVGDRQHLAAFIRRSTHQGYCASDLDLSDIIDAADDALFQQVLTNPNHVLTTLLSDKVDLHYHLRARHHNRQLIPKINKMLLICDLFLCTKLHCVSFC